LKNTQKRQLKSTKNSEGKKETLKINKSQVRINPNCKLRRRKKWKVKGNKLNIINPPNQNYLKEEKPILLRKEKIINKLLRQKNRSCN
jgi:hypothetical protein